MGYKCEMDNCFRKTKFLIFNRNFFGGVEMCDYHFELFNQGKLNIAKKYNEYNDTFYKIVKSTFKK